MNKFSDNLVKLNILSSLLLVNTHNSLTYFVIVHFLSPTSAFLTHKHESHVEKSKRTMTTYREARVFSDGKSVKSRQDLRGLREKDSKTFPRWLSTERRKYEIREREPSRMFLECIKQFVMEIESPRTPIEKRVGATRLRLRLGMINQWAWDTYSHLRRDRQSIVLVGLCPNLVIPKNRWTRETRKQKRRK